MFHRTIFVLILTLLFVATPSSYCGKLDSFESSVKNEYSSQNNDNYDNSNNDNDNELANFVFELLYYIALYGGSNSFDRVDDSLDNNIESRTELREKGELLIPFFRVDMSYQKNNENISAYDYRLEAGYAAFAVNIQQTLYYEDSINDSLKLSRLYGAYRMSFGTHVEIDLGIGRFDVNGNEKNSYLYVTLPILIHPTPNLGFEFRPSAGGNYSEIDASIILKSEEHLKSKDVAIKLGYKKISTSSNSLQGPYVGICAIY